MVAFLKQIVEKLKITTKVSGKYSIYKKNELQKGRVGL